MRLRTCLDCGRPAPGSRCPSCRAERQRAKDARRPTRRSHAEQERRRRLVAEHVEEYGWWCPGAADLDHGAHGVEPGELTADHLTPVAAGGREDGPLRVLCRSKNSGRGAR